MTKEEEHIVVKEKAFHHAITGLLIHSYTGLKEWKNAKVDSDPLLIYDLNGQPLFYEFSVIKANRKIGLMKIAANKVLGSSVITAELDPREWNLSDVQERIEKIISDKYPSMEITSIRLVCYDFPKLGMFVILKEPKTKETKVRLLFDILTIETVPLEPRSVWSLIERIKYKDRPDNLARWESEDKLVQILRKEADLCNLDFEKQGNPDPEFLTVMERKLGAIIKVDNYLFPDNWITSKELNITPQLKGGGEQDMSATAALKMILDFFGFTDTQEQIQDTLFETTAYHINTITTRMREHYNIELEHDSSPTFNETVSEIRANRPILEFGSNQQTVATFKVAVVCGGYKYHNTIIEVEDHFFHFTNNHFVKIWVPREITCDDFWISWRLMEQFFYSELHSIYFRPL